MIKSLFIKNFQSHKCSKLEFSKGLNCIIGSSDSGKSSIIRALNLIIFNNPGGLKFISHGQKECLVRLQFFDENKSVTRRKGTSTNIYKLGSDFFESFKNGVPTTIENYLNLSETNFQFQFDGIFLLSQTSGKVAEYFNKIANIDKIDTSIKIIQSKINGLRKEQKFENDQIEHALKKVNELPDLRTIENELEKLEKLENTIRIKQSQVKEIKQIQKKLYLNRESQTQFTKIVEIKPYIKKIEILQKSILDIQKRKDKLNSTIFKSHQFELEKVKFVKLKEIEPHLNLIFQKFESVKILESQKLNLDHDIVELKKIQNEKNKERDILKKNKQLFENHMPKKCPLCNSPYKNEKNN